LTEGDAQELTIGTAEQARYHRGDLSLPIFPRCEDERSALLEIPTRSLGREILAGSCEQPVALELQTERRSPIEIGLEHESFLRLANFADQPVERKLFWDQVHPQAGTVECV